MIFAKRSQSVFSSLNRIETLLFEKYKDLTPKDTLFVINSIPSLSPEGKNELISHIASHQKIIFWCYGDLVWNISFWKSIEGMLLGKNITWVVSSPKWKRIAQEFIESDYIAICEHPFELPDLIQTNEMIRNNLNLKEDEKLIFYAGRKSLQKNIPWLLKLMDEYSIKYDTNLKLLLAGSWCNYGRPQYPMSESLLDLEKILIEYIAKNPFKIFDLGEVSHQETLSILKASDLAISMSTFLEEDYGVFLREARSLGIPVLATNWGGHSSLKDNGSFLVNLKCNENSLELDYEDAVKKMNQTFTYKRVKFEYQSNLFDFNSNANQFKGMKKGKNVLDLARWNTIMAGP
jgi:glycosyltransferase involved in cell wall biosynthesis